ncbi:glycosyltransferase [Providencia rettgeri]
MIKKLNCPNSEHDIQKHWKFSDKIYISCVCIAYNHESYISDAIDSILAQESDYRFELIIHDDNSNDSTKNILLDYKSRFPNIIKLILQKENQYSTGKKIIPLTLPFIEGSYIAFCEGDDFWTTNNKIHIQYTNLIQNPEINICFSASKKSFDTMRTESYAKHSNVQTIYSLSNVIRGGGEFMPTASIMVKKSCIDTLPNWYYIAPVGDYFLQIYASTPNGALYLPEETCNYRASSIGSWTAQRSYINIEKINNEASLYRSIFLELSQHELYRPDAMFALSKQLFLLSIILIKNKKYTLAKEMIINSRMYYKNINTKQMICYYMRNIFPLFRILLKIHNRNN